MPKSEKLIKALDGKDIYLAIWSPESPPRAVIQMVHGLGEYAGRYDEWAGRFAEAGCAVYLHDQRGHGKTQGRRGAVRDYALLLDDVQAVRNCIEQDYPEAGGPGLPVALYGHSMGGNVALNFLLRRQPERYACAVITCPWLDLYDPPAPMRVSFLNGIAKVMPMFTVHTGLNRGILSHDTGHIEKISSEKFYHSMIGARILMQIIENGQYAVRHASELSVPTILMQAGDDKLVSPDVTRKFADGAPDILEFHTYPNLYHEIHNEIEREEIFNDIITYLREHI